MSAVFLRIYISCKNICVAERARRICITAAFDTERIHLIAAEIADESYEPVEIGGNDIIFIGISALHQIVKTDRTAAIVYTFVLVGTVDIAATCVAPVLLRYCLVLILPNIPPDILVYSSTKIKDYCRSCFRICNNPILLQKKLSDFSVRLSVASAGTGGRT